jgi:sortase A
MAFLRFFGKLLISVGFGVLLFVLWTLYGTGILTAREQSALADEFDAQAAFPDKELPPGGELKPQGPPPEFDPAGGDPVFRLKIPKIDLEKIVVEGVDDDQLAKGPGHYPECGGEFDQPFCTAFPASFPGEKGRVIVSGHRTTHGQPFWDLNRVQPGDEIIAETKWGTYRYEVTSQEVVDDSNLTVTVQIHSKRELVLTTCNPRFSAAERLIIYSELVERIA